VGSKVLSRQRLEQATGDKTMPTDYEQLFRQAGRTPSPGGVDLNALLSRGISGTIAGAQEETGIKRRQVSSDLLSQEIARAAQELQNRVQGYEFGKVQDFDRAIEGGNPSLSATFADAFDRSGNRFLTGPTSRMVLGEMHKFTPGVDSLNNIAASILKNWQVVNYDGTMREPAEVAWARNVLRVPGMTSGAGTNAPSAPGQTQTTEKQPPVPYGLGRAALGSGVTGAGAFAGGKLFSSLAPKVVPKLAGRFPIAGPVLSGILSGALTQSAYEKLDPDILQAQREHPIASIVSSLGGGSLANRLQRFVGSGPAAFATSMASEAVEKGTESITRRLLGAGGGRTVPGSTTTPRLALPPPSSAVGATGGPNPQDFVKRFKTFYGRNPTQQEYEQFTRGTSTSAPRKLLNAPPTPRKLLNAPPTQPKPYKPKVKGYEDFLQKQFGE
jgi:hypothetical protein